MPTHAQCLPSVLPFATITTRILIAGNGIQVEITVSRTHYRKKQGEQVGNGVGDLIVEDCVALVLSDPTDNSNV